MSEQEERTSGAGGEALPRELVMARRAAAYASFVLAGWAVVSAAWILLDSYPAYLRAITRPWDMDFWMLLPPGVAAALGAAAVHSPFMRAVRAGRAPWAHAWAAAGVLAAHAAYAALVFGVALGREALLRDAPLLSARVLSQAEDYALVAGAMSLILGFLPNVLFAEAFAGFMLVRQPAVARPGAAHSSLSKGAGDASSIFAE